MPKIVISIFLCLFLFSCDTELDRDLVFSGDSIAAKWDVAYSFPSRTITNYGVDGRKLAELPSLNIPDDDLVIIIGTNDISCDETAFNNLVANYAAKIKTNKAKRIFVFSLLPREIDASSAAINQQAKRFNTIMSEELPAQGIIYLDVYDKFLLNGKLNPEFSDDGLHPNKYGYDILAAELRKKM